MEIKHLNDLIEHYTKTTDKIVVYIRNKKLELCTDVDQINAVWSYYKEHLSDDVYYAITHSDYNFIEFNDPETAVEFIEDNFPRRDQVEDIIYWFDCMVIMPSGAVYYENEAIRPGLNRVQEEIVEGLTEG